MECCQISGKMTFEEFSKVLDESKKSKGRSERNRKRKADGDFVYEEEEDYEAEDDKLSDENVEDESWVPDAPKTTGWPQMFLVLLLKIAVTCTTTYSTSLFVVIL